MLVTRREGTPQDKCVAVGFWLRSWVWHTPHCDACLIHKQSDFYRVCKHARSSHIHHTTEIDIIINKLCLLWNFISINFIRNDMLCSRYNLDTVWFGLGEGEGSIPLALGIHDLLFHILKWCIHPRRGLFLESNPWHSNIKLMWFCCAAFV